MSRCKACDKKMSEFELTRKYAGTNRYVDLCNKCFSSIASEVIVQERDDLRHEGSEENNDTV